LTIPKWFANDRLATTAVDVYRCFVGMYCLHYHIGLQDNAEEQCRLLHDMIFMVMDSCVYPFKAEW
jgi:hypothetical protein